MCPTHHKIEMLDTLTRVVTAFDSWGEFKAAMETGYVPTIRTPQVSKRARLNTRQYALACTNLREMVVAEGFRVYDGSQTIGG